MKKKSWPYYYYIQDTFVSFWNKLGIEKRNVLFIFGMGFDPRCIPGLRHVFSTFKRGAAVSTCCARFTNLFDEQLDENRKNTFDCLQQSRYFTNAMSGSDFQHNEIEVNMFSVRREFIGDIILIEEFKECYEQSFDSYTDIIVDISTFPRSLVYSLLGFLWTRRRRKQNLFAILTEVASSYVIEEYDYTPPTFMLGKTPVIEPNETLWIPVLGGRIERFEHIHNFLNPSDIFPIIPFTSSNPRGGDDILLSSRVPLFEKWKVPFQNVMHASGDIPFDVYRKIIDIVNERRKISADISIVVSALSGRSLSLGVLLAALTENLAVCHAQPISFKVSSLDRDRIKQECESVIPMIYWLDGQLYETDVE